MTPNGDVRELYTISFHFVVKFDFRYCEIMFSALSRDSLEIPFSLLQRLAISVLVIILKNKKFFDKNFAAIARFMTHADY